MAAPWFQKLWDKATKFVKKQSQKRKPTGPEKTVIQIFFT